MFTNRVAGNASDCANQAFCGAFEDIQSYGEAGVTISNLVADIFH